jgi:hypothetical protein
MREREKEWERERADVPFVGKKLLHLTGRKIARVLFQ